MLQDLLKPYKVILASQSPRRKQLLGGLDIDFEVLVRDGIDEIVPDGLNKIEIPEYLAKLKSESYIDLLDSNTIVITADTIVWFEQKEIGKPKDRAGAVEMLARLSGNMHEVVTGVCLRTKNQIELFTSLSKVWFREVSPEEINYYIDKYKPYDKAGSYGIQEWLGYTAIEKLEGSFYNVMGLPVQTLYCKLIKFVSNEEL